MNVSSDLTKEPGFELYMTGRLKPSQEKTINSHTNRVCIASLFNCTLQQHSAQKITCSELQPAVQKDKKEFTERENKPGCQDAFIRCMSQQYSCEWRVTCSMLCHKVQRVCEIFMQHKMNLK